MSDKQQKPLPVFDDENGCPPYLNWFMWMIGHEAQQIIDYQEREFTARENWRKQAELGLTVEQFIEAATTGRHLFDPGPFLMDGPYCKHCGQRDKDNKHFTNHDGTPMLRGT
jgi:hypothetical protein